MGRAQDDYIINQVFSNVHRTTSTEMVGIDMWSSNEKYLEQLQILGNFFAKDSRFHEDSSFRTLDRGQETWKVCEDVGEGGTSYPVG